MLNGFAKVLRRAAALLEAMVPAAAPQPQTSSLSSLRAQYPNAPDHWLRLLVESGGHPPPLDDVFALSMPPASQSMENRAEFDGVVEDNQEEVSLSPKPAARVRAALPLRPRFLEETGPLAKRASHILAEAAERKIEYTQMSGTESGPQHLAPRFLPESEESSMGDMFRRNMKEPQKAALAENLLERAPARLARAADDLPHREGNGPPKSFNRFGQIGMEEADEPLAAAAESVPEGEVPAEGLSPVFTQKGAVGVHEARWIAPYQPSAKTRGDIGYGAPVTVSKIGKVEPPADTSFDMGDEVPAWPQLPPLPPEFELGGAAAEQTSFVQTYFAQTVERADRWNALPF